MIPIFVTQRLVEIQDYAEIRECLDIRWGAFLKECGLIPIAVPSKADCVDYFDTFESNGVLLTGGNSISRCAPEDPLSKERDDFERKMIKEAIHREIPILGVCRGMQMIADYFDVPVVKMEGHVAGSHPIEISRESRLAPFYDFRSEVNSYHEYCVTDAGDNFYILARMTEDNTIEAIEHREFNISAVMWHPERTSTFSPGDIAFFRSFFKNSKNLGEKNKDVA